MNNILKVGLVIMMIHFTSLGLAQNFSLKGEIRNFKGSSILLSINRVHGIQSPDTVRIPVNGGKFSFEAPALRSPAFASLLLFEQKRLQFVLFDEAVQIGADIDNLKSATISGGPQIDQFNQYRKELMSQDGEISVIIKKLKSLDKGSEEAKQLEIKRTELIRERTDKIVDYIRHHPTSAVSPFLLWANDLDMPTKVELYTGLDSNLLADNSYFKFISPAMIGQRNNAIGKQVPELSQADTSGNMVAISDFRGKYLLIDFWASWCIPCRAANPGLVKLYNHFKSKNFTILGVSLDMPGAKQKWMDAIHKDKLTWNHVSDLRGWDNEISRAFGINSIPATVLVDPNGKIIARNISEKELDTLLKELLN